MCVSCDTVLRWKKKFESGTGSIKNALDSVLLPGHRGPNFNLF